MIKEWKKLNKKKIAKPLLVKFNLKKITDIKKIKFAKPVKINFYKRT